MQEEEQVLRKAETWDIEKVVVTPAVQKPRAVVSVAFSRDEFDQVAHAAQRSDMKTSEFIRGAALSKAKVVTHVTSIAFAGISLTGMITAGVSVSGTSTAAKTTDDIQELVTIGRPIITDPAFTH